MSSDHGSRLRDQLAQLIQQWWSEGFDAAQYANQLAALLRASASAPPEKEIVRDTETGIHYTVIGRRIGGVDLAIPKFAASANRWVSDALFARIFEPVVALASVPPDESKLMAALMKISLLPLDRPEGNTYYNLSAHMKKIARDAIDAFKLRPSASASALSPEPQPAWKRYFVNIKGFDDDTAYVRADANGRCFGIPKTGREWLYTAATLAGFEEKVARGIWRELTAEEAAAISPSSSPRPQE